MVKFAVSPWGRTDIGKQRCTQGATYEKLLFSVTSGLACPVGSYSTVVPGVLRRRVYAVRTNNGPIRLRSSSAVK